MRLTACRLYACKGQRNGHTGLEPPTVSSCNDNTLRYTDMSGGAESGAVERQTTPDDPDFRRVVAGWPTLPEPIKAAVMALVNSVTSVTGTETPADGRKNRGFGDKPTPDPSSDGAFDTDAGTRR